MKSGNPQGDHLELEVKFLIPDADAFIEQLKGIGAIVSHERVFEQNLRFDTPDGRLRTASEVLRLRRDSHARLTFKGPAQADQPVAVRPEIEFTVSDFREAYRFLEALGFKVSVIYEKYRTTFSTGDAEISLDEMPFGIFCEIEADSAQSVQDLAEKLGLIWEERILASYLQIFDALKSRQGWTMRDLTFENFVDLKVAAGDLKAAA